MVICWFNFNGFLLLLSPAQYVIHFVETISKLAKIIWFCFSFDSQSFDFICLGHWHMFQKLCFRLPYSRDWWQQLVSYVLLTRARQPIQLELPALWRSISSCQTGQVCLSTNGMLAGSGWGLDNESEDRRHLIGQVKSQQLLRYYWWE